MQDIINKASAFYNSNLNAAVRLANLRDSLGHPFTASAISIDSTPSNINRDVYQQMEDERTLKCIVGQTVGGYPIERWTNEKAFINRLGLTTEDFKVCNTGIKGE